MNSFGIFSNFSWSFKYGYISGLSILTYWYMLSEMYYILLNLQFLINKGVYWAWIDSTVDTWITWGLRGCLIWHLAYSNTQISLYKHNQDIIYFVSIIYNFFQKYIPLNIILLSVIIPMLCIIVGKNTYLCLTLLGGNATMPPHSFIGHWHVTLFRYSTISLIIGLNVRGPCYTLNNIEKLASTSFLLLHVAQRN